MRQPAAHLFPHELQALLEALRRDTEMELQRARTHPHWAEYHRGNARLNARLIDLLAPGPGDGCTDAALRDA